MFEKPLTFIFTGRSGCGKGTQVELLRKYIARYDERHRRIFYLETGARFRDFIAEEGYTRKLSKEVYRLGDRQPDFLAVWMWSHMLIDDLTGQEHLIIDGTPRSLNEAKILEGAMAFYGRIKPYVVYLDVSRAWSEKHLLSRGRSDDDLSGVKKRLDWYDRDVAPAIEFYRNNPAVTFVQISGEQSVGAVHEELIQKIFQP